MQITQIYEIKVKKKEKKNKRKVIWCAKNNLRFFPLCEIFFVESISIFLKNII